MTDKRWIPTVQDMGIQIVNVRSLAVPKEPSFRPRVLPSGVARITETVYVNGKRHLNVVMKDGTPRTITPKRKRRHGHAAGR